LAPVSFFAEELEPRALFEWYRETRARLGISVLTLDHGGIRKVLEALRDQEMVITAIDRDITGTGHVMPFFGRPAPIPLGPAAIALRLGAPLLPVCVYRLPDDTYMAEGTPLIYAESTGDSRADQVRATERVPRRVEPARFYRIGTPIAIRVNDSVARITLSFHLANEVAAIIAEERFDVLHFHEPLMPALPMTMLRMSTTANVGTFHAFARSNVGYFYGRPFLEPYLQHLHRAITVSEPARDFVQRYFPGYPMRVIPNGIDLSIYRPGLPPIRHLRDEHLNILFV